MLHRRETFNEVAELYDRMRPGYAPEVIDAIVELSGIPEGGRIVEVGCGTGQITVPFAERGYRITALEPGDALAALAARKLERYPNVEIVGSTFEKWNPAPGSFDLLVAAQSFHWVDPEVGCAHAAEAVRSGGGVALVWHRDLSKGTEFWNATQPLYDRYFPKMTDAGWEPIAERIDRYRTLLSAYPFVDLHEFRHPWSVSHSTVEYLDLLNTYSDHRLLPEPDRTNFFSDMHELIERMGGRVERNHETQVLVARRV